jgi:chemotaxis protein MotB
MSEDIHTQKGDPGDEDNAGSYLAPVSSRRKQGEESATSLWLITFTDIMALMLTFFVLLYSMSVPQEEDWETMTDGLRSQFTKTYSARWSQGRQDTFNVNKIDFSQAQDLTYLKSVLANAVEKDARLKNIAIIPQEKTLIISVPQDLLFESGSAEIAPEGKQVLFALGNTMARIRNRIEVIGHTDPQPLERSKALYDSNWELSLARASVVSSILENAGYNRPVIVRGLSSSRYEDLPETMSEQQRLSLARRVDIVIMPDDGTVRTKTFDVDILR